MRLRNDLSRSGGKRRRKRRRKKGGKNKKINKKEVFQRQKERTGWTDCGQVGDQGACSQAAYSLDAQALVGHDVEDRVRGGGCVPCGPDEAVSAEEDG